MAPSAADRPVLLVCLLIALAALPDAMVPIALRSAVVEHWQVTGGQAHWFMTTSLFGALVGLPVLIALQRRVQPGMLIAGAALVNAGALGGLCLDVSWTQALMLRGVEGMADLISLAVLLGLLEGGSRRGAGRRYGPAGMALMLALSAGFAIGGVAVESAGPGIFLVGAAFCLLLAVSAAAFNTVLSRGVDRTRRVSRAARRAGRSVELWPSLCFSFGDRALSAVVSVTITLYLVDALDLAEPSVGGAMSLSMLVLALGAWPAGVLVDRIGALPVRVLASLGYAAAFTALVAAPWMGMGGVTLLLVALGLAGSGLLPSTYVLASRAGHGATDMGAVQTAGSMGYLGGVLGAGAMAMAGGMTTETVRMILVAFGAGYLLLNIPGVVALAGWRATFSGPRVGPQRVSTGQVAQR